MKRKSSFIVVALILTMLFSACSSATPTTAPSTSNTSSNPSTDVTNIVKLNLNTVTGDELLSTIPGFPNRMIREFQEYRPYVSIQQFRREIGKYVGDAQVAEYEKYVYVPIAINDSDSATMQQIPGLDATEADTLISGRPYASADDFLTKLSGLVSAEELTVARSYLGD